jgi:23S rRNA pseudouridine1911/1915/1917 synthase
MDQRAETAPRLNERGPVSVDITAALDGLRVDRVVAMLTGLSRVQASELVAGSKVFVDGAPPGSRSQRLHLDEVLTIDWEPTTPFEREAPSPEPSVPLEIAFADDDLVVIDKLAGLVVHPGPGNPTGTLINGLLARFPELAEGDLGGPVRPGIVHRLDKGTSGLMVVARSERAYQRLKAQIAARLVERHYTALVSGTVANDSAMIDAPVGRSASDRTRMAVSWRGKPAQTTYQVLARFPDPSPTTLLDARLQTGRTHQIRVHLAAVGHPVIGDPKYARSTSTEAGRQARRTLTKLPSLRRQFLHAHLLAFDHPITAEHLEFRSPLPADLASVLAAVRSENSDT